MRLLIQSKNAIIIQATFFILLCSEIAAAADLAGRYALVVGNKSYATAPLNNSVNDATAVAKKLESVGFEVTLLVDIAKDELKNQVFKFYQSVGKSKSDETLAVFYYAGHAIQVNHRNYLVPVNASFGSKSEFMEGLYDINDLFAQMPIFVEVQNIVILDACRDNPFEEPLTSASANNDGVTADGLAPLRAPSGTLIAYATEPGSVAEDGKGKNGTYTKYLLRHISKRINVEEVFKKVRRDVAKATKKRQIPWEHSSLLDEVFINPPKNRKMPDLMTF